MNLARIYQYRALRVSILRNWYQCNYGRYLGHCLQPALNRLLERLPVNIVLRAGVRLDGESGAAVNESEYLLRIHGCESVFIAACNALPVQSHVLDCVVLQHELDITKNPHRMLREADRALADDGYLVIVGFNPWSILGCMKPIGQFFGVAPWNCRFHRIGKLKDWLELLDFDVCQIDTFSCSLPFWSERLSRPGFRFYAKLIALRMAFFGNIYCVTARKRTVPLMPVRFVKQSRKLKFSPRLNPSVRAQVRTREGS